MKKISVYIFLILFGFSSTSFADEDEFDIEGFRLGMNLLDHFTEQTIHNGDEDYYKKKTYTDSLPLKNV